MNENKELARAFLGKVWNDGEVEGVGDRVRISRVSLPDQRFVVQEPFAQGDRVWVTGLASWQAVDRLTVFSNNCRRIGPLESLTRRRV